MKGFVVYYVKDNEGRETRCETLAEAEYVQACWFKCGSHKVEITGPNVFVGDSEADVRYVE